MNFFKDAVTVVPKVDISTNYVFISEQEQFNKYLPEILKLQYWVLDTETTGRDFVKDKVILMQIGNRHQQFLIDTRSVNIKALQPAMEDESLRKIMQYGQFDYLMINGTFGFRIEGIRDTMIAEQILMCGIQKFGFAMDDQALKYLNIKLDKGMQKSFINHRGPFTLKQKEYAALDCIIPDYIMIEQHKELKRWGLLETWILESNAIPAFSDIEYYGMVLEESQWELNIRQEKTKLEIAKEEFLEAAGEYVGVDMLGTPNINPNSPAQILKLFQEIFGKKEMVDRDGKPGTGADILEKLCLKFDNPKIVTTLLKIRGHEKNIGTYGYTYLAHIHPITQRFHPKIGQIGTETGRPNGKKPNMLNIPAKPHYRHPWIAGEGRKILTNDYGACELRIMASMSGDPVMCKGFNEGLDYHTFTASQFIKDNEPHLREFIPDPKGEPGKGKLGDFILDSEGNKQPNPMFGQLVPYDRVLKIQRSVAKTINFGLAYGMGPGKLADTLGIARELAKEYIVQFNTTFAVLVAWLRENQDMAIVLRACSYQASQRAINTNSPEVPDLAYAETHLGRKRFFVLPKAPPLLEVADRYRKYKIGTQTIQDPKDPSNIIIVPKYCWKAEGLQDLDYDPTNPWDEKMPKTLKKYYQRIAGIKREGGNSPIQGGNADITKIAMYELRKWFRQVEKERNNGEYLAHVALQVYDELIVDCPEGMAKEVAAKMDELMQKAGDRVITQVPVETGCIIADSWVKG